MPEVDLRSPDGMEQLISGPIEQLTKEGTEPVRTIVQGTDLIGVLEEGNVDEDFQRERETPTRRLMLSDS